MRPRRWLLVLTASFGPLLLALVWFETQRAALEAAEQPPPPARPGVLFQHHVERVRDRAGRVTWQFEADRVEVLDSGDYLLTGLQNAQYLREGYGALHLRADRARFEARTQNLALVGHVRVASEQGLRFRADRLYWFDQEGRMVVPRVRRLEWTDPDHPDVLPTRVKTRRLFYWPREDRLELPDSLTAEVPDKQLSAAHGSARPAAGTLDLAGPAELKFQGALNQLAAEAGKQVKQLNAAVGEGGTIHYSRRDGAAALEHAVRLELPDDGLKVTCDKAVYSGDEQRRLNLQGNLEVTDPGHRVTAASAEVDTLRKRADLNGPVALTETAADGTLTILDCQRLSYWYAKGSRSADAQGEVQVRSGNLSAGAPRVKVNLETKTARLSGGVTVRVEPAEPAPVGGDAVDRAKSEPVTIRAPRVTQVYAAGRRHATCQGPVALSQPKRQGKADHLEYDQEREVIVLTGHVRFEDSDGQQARCVKLTWHRRTDELRIETPAEAEFYFESDE